MRDRGFVLTSTERRRTKMVRSIDTALASLSGRGRPCGVLAEA